MASFKLVQVETFIKISLVKCEYGNKNSFNGLVMKAFAKPKIFQARLNSFNASKVSFVLVWDVRRPVKYVCFHVLISLKRVGLVFKS